MSYYREYLATKILAHKRLARSSNSQRSRFADRSFDAWSAPEEKGRDLNSESGPFVLVVVLVLAPKAASPHGPLFCHYEVNASRQGLILLVSGRVADNECQDVAPRRDFG